MPRLYLVSIFVLINFVFWSQGQVAKFIKEGNKLFQQGDYYYAMDYFEKAYAIDSNSVELLWQLAETYRSYKDYRKAEDFYKKVYEKEEGLLYPDGLLLIGLMQKMNGKYEAAKETFIQAKKIYAKNKKSPQYLKSKKELEACLFAIKHVPDNDYILIDSITQRINTEDSEFGHALLGDEIFVFSSMKADSINNLEEVYSKDYQTRLYKLDLKDPQQRDSLIGDLVFQNKSAGNGSFSKDGRRFYFSLCENSTQKYTCQIMVAQHQNDRWTSIDSLGSIINFPASNNTMPSIHEIEGEEYLFFSSDNPNGLGGLDLYYSKVKNGNEYAKPVNLKALNSLENEVSPHFDTIEKRLYFSSTWHLGLGGMDVFYSQWKDKNFQAPVNAGAPINSPANDLYFFRNKESYFVTSNRLGVKYSKNPTCCSDVFHFIKRTPPLDTFEIKKETFAELNQRLPIRLYFHNDEPNPRSWDTTTSVNYINSYKDYRSMLPKYQQEYSNGLQEQEAMNAKEDIEDFFIQYVDQGVSDLNLFRDLLLVELKKGRRIKVNIKGFASPLAKSDYNVNLTKRRIYSLINYILQYQDSVFAPYFKGTSPNGGKLLFSEIPFGEDNSSKLVSDNLNDLKNSVYSRSASLERKIEIQSIELLDDVAQIPTDSASYILDTNLVHFGKAKKGDKVKAQYTLSNPGPNVMEIENIRVPCNCSEATVDKRTLKPGEKALIEFIFDTKDYDGEVVKSVYVKVKNKPEEIRLILIGEVTR